MADLNFDPNRGYSTAELSQKTGIHVQKLERWRMSGVTNKGPAYTKIGRSVLYRGADVLAWLDAATVPSEAA